MSCSPGATGVIGRQAVPVLGAAHHQVIGLARTFLHAHDAATAIMAAIEH